MFVCVYAGADGSPGAGGGGGGEEEGPEGQAQPAEAQALRHPPISKITKQKSCKIKNSTKRDDKALVFYRFLPKPIPEPNRWACRRLQGRGEAEGPAHRRLSRCG